MLAVFGFTVAFSAFHLVKGFVLPNVHLIIGGFFFTAVSIPMVLICRHSRNSGDEGVETGAVGVDKPTDRDKLR